MKSCQCSIPRTQYSNNGNFLRVSSAAQTLNPSLLDCPPAELLGMGLFFILLSRFEGELLGEWGQKGKGLLTDLEEEKKQLYQRSFEKISLKGMTLEWPQSSEQLKFIICSARMSVTAGSGDLGLEWIEFGSNWPLPDEPFQNELCGAGGPPKSPTPSANKLNGELNWGSAGAGAVEKIKQFSGTNWERSESGLVPMGLV